MRHQGKFSWLYWVVFIVTLALSGCGGGGSGSTSASGTSTVSAASVTGTWKVSTINSADMTPYSVSLTVDASTYTIVFPISFPGQTACTEYGTWALSGNTLTTTPISGNANSCGSQTVAHTIAVSGTKMTDTSATNGTWVYQKQTATPVTNSTMQGTWKMMAKNKAGTATSLSQSNVTLALVGNNYTLTGINCSETGTWSISGSTLNFTPAASGTCGNNATYTETTSLNASLMTTTDSVAAYVWQRQTGAANTAPASVIAAGASGGVNIGWQLVGGATSYNIYRGTASGTLATKTLIGSVVSGAYLDATAVVGTTYYYQITSVDPNGESQPSAEVSGTATASTSPLPSPVIGLTAKPGNASASLFWNAVSGATSYNIYFVHTPAGIVPPAFIKSVSTNPAIPSSYSLAFWTKLVGTNIASPGYTVTGLVNGDTYQYMVTAVNANGESLSTSYVETSPSAPPATAWTPRTSGTNANLYDITYNGTQFLAVGGGLTSGAIFATDTAVMLTSTDGLTWTQAATGGPGLMRVIWCSSLSKYVAVGIGGTVRTSPDGLAWTTQASGTTNGLWGITWSSSLNKFVAVGDFGTVITSPDGVTWSLGTSGTVQHLRRILKFGNTFVAVGWGGTIITSTDGGVSWSTPPAGAPTTQGIMDIGNNGITYVAVGGTTTSGIILTSPDAVTWTQRTTTTYSIHSVAWDGTKFIASGVSGNVLTSPDGITWNNQTTSTTSTFNSISSNGNNVILVGDGGTIMTLP